MIARAPRVPRRRVRLPKEIPTMYILAVIIPFIVPLLAGYILIAAGVSAVKVSSFLPILSALAVFLLEAMILYDLKVSKEKAAFLSLVLASIGLIPFLSAAYRGKIAGIFAKAAAPYVYVTEAEILAAFSAWAVLYAFIVIVFAALCYYFFIEKQPFLVILFPSILATLFVALASTAVMPLALLPATGMSIQRLSVDNEVPTEFVPGSSKFFWQEDHPFYDPDPYTEIEVRLLHCEPPIEVKQYTPYSWTVRHRCRFMIHIRTGGHPTAANAAQENLYIRVRPEIAGLSIDINEYPRCDVYYEGLGFRNFIVLSPFADQTYGFRIGTIYSNTELWIYCDVTLVKGIKIT